MIASITNMDEFLDFNNIEGQDDFLKRIVNRGVKIPKSSFSSSSEIQYSDLKSLIDRSFYEDNIPREMHRTLIQVAQLRDHQFFLSQRFGRHANENETIESWKEGYHEKFAAWYEENYPKIR
jgi:hypothetical protein